MSLLKRLFLTSLVPLLLIVPPCLAEPTDISPLLAELKLAASETATLSSRFVQEKHLSIFAERLLSQGRFIYQKPDWLRWELLTPAASGFVLQGEKGERWNGLSREKERFSIETDPIMGMIAQQLLAWARVDIDWLQQRYRMELQTSEPVNLRLYPLDPGEAGFIDYLQILFADDRRHVAEVLMVEKEGDSTLLRFSDVEINIELSPDAFETPVF
jgi:outer membrane lipoprotein-sorting protein